MESTETPAQEWDVPRCEPVMEFYRAAFAGRQVAAERSADGSLVAAQVTVGPYRLRLHADPAAEDSPPGRRWSGPQLPLPMAVDGETLLRIIAAGGRVDVHGDDDEAFVVHDPAGRRWVLPAARRSSE